MVGLRLMAIVHRLAIERRAPGVALYLPTLGGQPPTGAFVADFAAAVVAALVDHPVETSRGLQQTPQTNESGRAALLRIALSHLGPDVPVHLHEIGASAGLNLRADHLPGLPSLEAGPMPEIVQRSGCDLDPLDPTTSDGRTALSSYVWVDDVVRFERLRHALQVAAQVPATVVRQDAATYVEGISLSQGTTTVVWHSAMWLYLPGDAKQRILRALTALGEGAAPDRRLAHVSWEWLPGVDDASAPFELVLRTWQGRPDDGSARLLARGHSHGGDVVLTGSTTLEGEPLLS
jgi:hypothetical protein